MSKVLLEGFMKNLNGLFGVKYMVVCIVKIGYDIVFFIEVVV